MTIQATAAHHPANSAAPDYNHYETVAPLFKRFASLAPDDPARAAVYKELVYVHLPLARNLASRFGRRGEPLEDLLQVARLGLLNAINRFDPERGVEFLSFAIPTITGDLRRHFRDRCWDLRVPRRLQELDLRIRRAVEELSHRSGRAPTTTELAEYLQVDRELVLDAMQAGRAYTAASLDTPAGAERDAPALVDTLGNEDGRFDAFDNHHALKPLLDALPARERRVLYLRFVQDWTQTQIASDVGVSQMHVSRILSATLTQLRTQMLAD